MKTANQENFMPRGLLVKIMSTKKMKAAIVCSTILMKRENLHCRHLTF